MEYSDTPKMPHHRVWILLSLVLAVLAGYLTVMFNLQIVHGDEYLSQSVTQIVRSSTVEAARGNITDRNGNLLVGNRQTYTLSFDASLLPDGVEQNEAILRLVNLCEEQNVDYLDRIPITTEEPYAFVEVSSTQQSQFDRYVKETLKPYLEKQIKKRKTSLENAASGGDAAEEDSFLDNLDLENLTAEQTIEAMRRSFDIDKSVSAADARKIMAVRWELALRKTYNTTSYVLASDISIDFITLVKDGDYYGADVGTATEREYYTSAAAHLLGYVGSINTEEYEALKNQGYSINAKLGKAGVESAFESYLHGTNGKRISNVNDEGKVTSELYTQEPSPGNTVELTIDLDFQEQVEQLLAQRVESMNAKDHITGRGAAAAVIEVGSGAVLALASYPTYDLSNFNKNYNDYANDPAKPLYNRATMGLYPPGSTLKPLTAIAALESGATTTSERIYDKGRWIYPGTSMGPFCWQRSGHGSVNVTSAISNSCNTYFAEMGYRMGMDTLREYLAAFGLGSKTGIETGDAAGSLPENPVGEDQAPWAAFGQSNQLYTPIQLANYIATLVSGGEHYSTHLLRSVRSYDNSAVLYSEKDAEPENIVDMDPAYLEAVKKGMLGYTQPGGQVYTYFKNCIVTAGAKTGTAQLGANKENNGVFVCFAPYDEPEIAVAIVIEKGGAGAALAETAVGILNAYFTEDEIATAIISENELLG